MPNSAAAKTLATYTDINRPLAHMLCKLFSLKNISVTLI